MTNSNAIRAIAAAVESTIGPKGLDTMLVDQFGEVVITNDGVTILELMDVSHPAARLLIKIARAQQAEVGDGTTTATILAGGLVAEGVNQVARGFPVARIIEGLRFGPSRALEFLQARAQPVRGIEAAELRQVALIAGRGQTDLADLVIEALKFIEEEKWQDPAFKLADTIVAREAAANEVFQGVILNKQRMNRQMPRVINGVKVLIIDDALAPEEFEGDALGTETGVARYLALRDEFRKNIEKVISLGVNLVLVDRGVDDLAEEILTEAGIMVVSRVAYKELRKTAELTGARLIKRTGLKRKVTDFEQVLGRAERVCEDEKLEQIRILGGAGSSIATIVVGAATPEIVGERERMARDAASAVQSALKGGLVPGGGAIELALARQIAQVRGEVRGMAAWGIDCLVEALKRPFAQIVSNAGFNPLEKLGDVMAAQAETGKDTLAIDCETGEVRDMQEIGVVDPALVKHYALKTAVEVAEAILRINTIIKKREHNPVNREI
ncbi:MAG: chaperonin [Syntrophomonadaceae bacterium]|nr:chaperonin [Syntrophomonadaceae bacterium]